MNDHTNHSLSFSQPQYKNLLRTTVIGQKMSYHKQLNSTNSYAKSLSKADMHHGMIILTDHQKSGRGRVSRFWFSPPEKGLTFSLIILPKINIRKSGLFSILSGVAIAECLIEYGIPVKLKWPNDVMVDGKKIAGILCESKISGQLVNAVIIGIGLNVNDKLNEYPFDLQNIVTSLQHITGTNYRREDILTNILFHFEELYKLVTNKQESILVKKWLSYNQHLGQKITFHQNDTLISGLFLGITPYGEAIVEINGKQEILMSGQIL